MHANVTNAFSCMHAVIVCPKLPTIHYGTVSVGNRQVGSTAIYNCDDGFILVGDSTRHCLSTGVWSGQPPVCKPRGLLKAIYIAKCHTAAHIIIMSQLSFVPNCMLRTMAE